MSNYQEYTVRVYPDRTEWLNSRGEYHRVDGPAIECASGTKYWCLNGKDHRVDGPAIEYANGTKYWYLHGKLHRVDGPAYEDTNGDKAWYLNGARVSEAEHARQTAKPAPPLETSCEGKVIEVDGKKYRLTEV